MFKKSHQTSPTDSLLPLANGENDYSVFSGPPPTIRGKGLGLGSSAASQRPLKSQGKLCNVSQKALSDVNRKSTNEKCRSNSSKGFVEESGAEVLSKPEQSFAVKKHGKTNCVMGEATAEIGRDVKLNWDSGLSPCMPHNNDLNETEDESGVEPIIQEYYNIHGEYPEIEYITTHQPNYDDEWYYYFQYPEMVPETFDRSFDSLDDAEIDLADLCLDSSSRSPSPVSLASFEIQLNEVTLDSANGENHDPDWEGGNNHNDVYIPTDHPFFANYSHE